MTATAEMLVESVESCSFDEACLIGTFIREYRSFTRVLSLSSGLPSQKSSSENSTITLHYTCCSKYENVKYTLNGCIGHMIVLSVLIECEYDHSLQNEFT
ncbi:hypothetical protein T4D_987 [Trichinella pseudospiralis]|uniref:Uncharacterized protein n=1 Tax=Trichinella pseudospiralis TaxID=6337 RepID=A0A0V1FLG9_TRIPS|nr:hypothetical protein T4D_987 [Trichinella pseudospiralis]